MSGYTPVNGILVVRKDPEPEMVGEIILPSQRQARPQTGTIVKSDATNYRPGEKIVFAPHSGVLAVIDGEPLVLMNPAEVLAVVGEP